MARTATLPLPQNTTHAAAQAAPIPEGPSAQPIPDWLSQQQTILRTAPDGDTAIRLLYADLLAERALLISENTRLQLALQAATAPAVRPARTVRPSLRPAVLALLRARVGMVKPPLSLPEIEQALDAPGQLTRPLREMVQAGQLVLNVQGYALPPAPEAPRPMPGKKGGRIRAPDAA